MYFVVEGIDTKDSLFEEKMGPHFLINWDRYYLGISKELKDNLSDIQNIIRKLEFNNQKLRQLSGQYRESVNVRLDSAFEKMIAGAHDLEQSMTNLEILTKKWGELNNKL